MRLKVYLMNYYGTGQFPRVILGSVLHHIVSWLSVDPPGTLHPCRGTVNYCSLRPLSQAPQMANLPSPFKSALVNARLVANKTFNVNDFPLMIWTSYA